MSKQKRNAQQTQKRILETASRLFAAKGFEGVSVNDIVRLARINKRMVYHYFGDKDGLYRSVLASHWLRVKEKFDGVLDFKNREKQDEDVRAKLFKLLDIYFDFVSENPDYTRTLLWEGLQGGAASRHIWTGVRGPLFAQVEFLLKTAQRQGKLKPGLSPDHLLISLLGTITFYFAYSSTLGDLVGGNPLSRENLILRKKQVIGLLETAFN